jgi:hypothetical protein
MRAIPSIVLHDLRGVRRDQVAIATVLLSVLGVAGVSLVGVFQHRLPGWSEWLPFVLAVTLLGGPGGFGFLFGLVMVDENDTGVRDALAVTPVPPTLFLLVRTTAATVWVLLWPLASVYLINWTWRAVNLSLTHWLAVVIPLALLTPSFALLIPTVARDKVGALAIFKGLSFITLMPLVLLWVPADAGYRLSLLLSPTGWTVEAFGAFLADRPASGLRWAAGGTIYAVVLLVLVVRSFRRKIYHLHQ